MTPRGQSRPIGELHATLVKFYKTSISRVTIVYFAIFCYHLQYEYRRTPDITDITPLGQSFHDFYDPNEYFGGDSAALLGWLYEKRHGEQVVVQTPEGNERELTVREQLAVELGHVCLLTHENTKDWTGLGLDDEQLKEAVNIAEFGVSKSVATVRLAVDSLKKEQGIGARLKELRQQNIAQSADILLAGAVVAVMAHDGKQRLNGEPFYTHPLSVSHILSIAFRDIPNWENHVDISWLRRLQYRAINHDAFEDSIPDKERAGTSFLTNPNLLPSPLLHKRLLESYEEPSEEAARVAEDIMVLTKSAGIDGRMKNRKYMSGFVGHVEAIFVKLADITHNLKIDPKEKPIHDSSKIQKWKDKLDIYKSNLTILKNHMLEAHSSTKEHVFVAGNIEHISKKRLVAVRKERLLSQLHADMVHKHYLAATQNAA